MFSRLIMPCIFPYIPRIDYIFLSFSDEVQKPGILRPVDKEVYRPALKRLEDFGIKATHTVTPLSS